MLHSFIVEELLAYPHTTHDDALDDLANILHPTCVSMMQRPDERSMEQEIYEKLHAKGLTLRPFIEHEEYDPLGEYRGSDFASDRSYSDRYAGGNGLDDFVRSYTM